ncbi:FMN-binding protein [Clostridium felsineum]|uniref:FMN-binding protein n=1 Tax=Clostridium felsineum TaxID=36839 RepID=UPI00214DCC56|nr:FMN-binding protein [Clostridium felsineum]MCR3760742.1 FMN-binding protein [Clostridium felsineum]
MNKKISILQIARFISQTIFLFLLPGLFVLSFSQIGTLYSNIIKGNFNFIALFPAISTTLVTLITTILLGRFFCGWMCSFGFMNDVIYMLSSKIFKTKFKISEKTDKFLKTLKYILLIFIVLFIWTTANKSLDNFSPWNAFAQIPNFKTAIFQYSLGFLILGIIIAGAAFVERFFCRYLCPLGAIFTLTSKFRLFKINKPNDKCGKCRLCTNNCAMGIDLYKYPKVKSGECIDCLKCLDVCPRKNTNLNIAGENINPTLASSIAIATFAGVYAMSNVVSSALPNSNSNTTLSSTSGTTATPSVKYKDGTYTGTGTGFNPNLNVSVTIKNGKISNIELLSNDETPRFFDRASSTVPNEIIKAQATNVDTVSGATRSSNGIMEAVQNALDKASASSTTNTATNYNNKTNSETQNSTTEAPSAQDNTSSNTASLASYKDGTYTGTGTGFNPNLNVSVTIKSGKISNIELLSNDETPRFFDRASSTVPDEIIKAQATNVDAVSGATRSSNGIMEAVQNALDKAK